MHIHKDCYGTILKIWIICGILVYLFIRFIPYEFISYPLSAIAISFMGFSVFFFRVPERQVAGGENAVTSVADGKVVIIDKVFEDEYLKRECIQVSVYMDFFNVHVNYWPLSGQVTYYRYHPGKYYLAFLPKASELNEHASVAMNSNGNEILFKQLAGTFARRIVTYASSGSAVKGDQCGIIKFGSRIDIFLPLDAQINVRLGERVQACQSIIAYLQQ